MYGVATALLGELPRSEALERIARAGFGVVEISSGPEHLGGWLADPAAMRRDLEAAGLRAWSVHASSGNSDPAAEDPSQRRAAIEAAQRYFRPALEVGAEVVICHPNLPRERFLAEDYQPSMARTAGSLKALAEEAGRVGIRLAVENMILRAGPRPATRIGELLGLIGPLGEHVGLCLDTGHAHASGVDVAKAACQAGERLFSLHIQDNHGQRNQDEHLVPGRGAQPCAQVLERLASTGYTGLIVLEINTRKAASRSERIKDLAEGLAFARTHFAAASTPAS